MILRCAPGVDFDHILDLLLKDGYTVTHTAEYVYEIEQNRDEGDHGSHLLPKSTDTPKVVSVKIKQKK